MEISRLGREKDIIWYSFCWGLMSYVVCVRWLSEKS